MLTGKELIEDVDQAKIEPGSFSFWWLGQQGYIVKTPTAVIYLDAFLTDYPGRLVKPLLKPDEVTNANIVCGTHDHIDHIDRAAWPAIAKASAGATFIVPDLLKQSVADGTEIPSPRIIGLDDFMSCSVSGVCVSGVASAHELLDRDVQTGRYPYMGYVIEAEGRTIYHAGDCCIYEGIFSRLRRWKLDVMFLPINGRDARRLSQNCIGNMTYQEAADLAGSINPRMVVPGHYDMFAMNLGDAPAFRDYMQIKYHGIEARICGHGERVTVAPLGTGVSK